MPLKRSFYLRNSVLVARELLGKILRYESEKGVLSGRIVETEAYLAESDPASHSYKGRSKRNEALFGEGGHAYIYHIHKYFCMDVVTGGFGIAQSVLLRAVEPLEGIEVMKKNRNSAIEKGLTSGPGKLCMAYGITRNMYGADLTKLPLTIEEGPKVQCEIITTTRVGISQAKDLPLRFYLKDNLFVSKK